jgi:tetratricopeptide (TPR) repeat protein
VLIERETESAVLGELVSGAVGGRGGAVLIEGEAGIGKTRLLEFARHHAGSSGANVLVATADVSDQRVALGATRALLGRAARTAGTGGPSQLGVMALRGSLAEPLGPGSRADEVVHALWWLIVELAEASALVLILDDAHWADQLTLRLLRMTARRAGELPLALIVAARPPVAGQPHAALAAERAFRLVDPSPLSVAGTGRLVTGALGDQIPVDVVARLRSVTRGNPLFITEMVRDLSEFGSDRAAALLDGRVPNQLVRLVADRFERLPAATADLAQAVAVLGADATPHRARLISGLDADAAVSAETDLRQERLLEPDRFAFAHPLVMTAIRDAIDPLRAAALHADAARLLAADGIDQSRVAEHLMHALPSGNAAVVATLRTAAATARRVGAFDDEARLLERARAEPPPRELVDTAKFEHGRALLENRTEAGVEILRSLLRDTSDQALRADCARNLARHLGLSGRTDEAREMLKTVLADLGDTDRELGLELLVELGFVSASRLDYVTETRALIAKQAQQCTGRTPGERLLLATARRMDAEGSGDRTAAATQARALLAERLHLDYQGGFAIGALTFGAVGQLLSADLLDDAERAMDGLRTDAETRAIPDLIAGAIWQHAQIAYQRGDLTRCELEAAASIEAGGEFARPLAVPWTVLAMSEQGRLAEAEQTLASARMLGPVPPSVLFTAILGIRGRLKLAQHEPDQAIDDLAEVLERNAGWGHRRVEPPWQPLLTEALVQAGRTREATEHARAYNDLAREWGTHRAHGHATRLQALVSPRTRAIELLEQARTSFAA